MTRESAIEGLRERKKRETRAALAWAAVHLAVARGFHTVSVDDIAAAAGVSPRTFSNYFSGKAEAVVARHVDRLHAIAAERSARPPKEPLWTAAAQVVVAEFCGEAERDEPPPAQWTDGIRMMLAEPAVHAEFLHQSRLAEGDIAAAVAGRIGSAPDALYPRLMASALGAVIEVSLQQWLRAPEAQTLREILEQAFERMGHVADRAG